jgi:hypothetical protein
LIVGVAVSHLSFSGALAATLGIAFSPLMAIALLEILPERRRVILATVFDSFARRRKTTAHTGSLRDTVYGS